MAQACCICLQRNNLHNKAAIVLGERYENPRLRSGFNAPQLNDDELFSDYTGRYEIAPGLVAVQQGVAAERFQSIRQTIVA